MGDWRLSLHLTLIVGMSDSGKSTFAFRYIFNVPAACRFIFDHQNRDGRRIMQFRPGVRICYTARDLEDALPSQCVVFNPWRMFPGDALCKQGAAFFCDWLYWASTRAPGKKFLLMNEINQFQDRETIQPELAKIVLAGREENIELVACAQQPHEINAAITGQSTELVCFHLDESVYLNKIKDLGKGVIRPEEVRDLPKGHFIALNRWSRARLSGKLF